MCKSLSLSLVALFLSLSSAVAGDTLDAGNASVSEQLKKLLAEEKVAQAAFDTDNVAYQATLPPFKQAEAVQAHAKLMREGREKDLAALTSDVTAADVKLAAADAALKVATDNLEAAKTAATTTNKYDDPAVRTADEEYVLKSREREEAFAGRESADAAAAQNTLRLETEFALKLRSPRKPSLVEVLRQELRIARTAEAKANADLAEPERLHDEAKAKAGVSKAALEVIQQKIREATNTGNGNGLKTEVEQLRRTTDVRVGEVATEIKSLRATTETRLGEVVTEVKGLRTTTDERLKALTGEVAGVKTEVSGLRTTLDDRLTALAASIKPQTVTVTKTFEYRYDNCGRRRRVEVTN